MNVQHSIVVEVWDFPVERIICQFHTVASEDSWDSNEMGRWGGRSRLNDWITLCVSTTEVG